MGAMTNIWLCCWLEFWLFFLARKKMLSFYWNSMYLHDGEPVLQRVTRSRQGLWIFKQGRKVLSEMLTI